MLTENLSSKQIFSPCLNIIKILKHKNYSLTINSIISLTPILISNVIIILNFFFFLAINYEIKKNILTIKIKNNSIKIKLRLIACQYEPEIEECIKSQINSINFNSQSLIQRTLPEQKNFGLKKNEESENNEKINYYQLNQKRGKLKIF